MDSEQDWTTLPDEVSRGPKYIMVFCDGTGKDGEKLPKKETPTNVYQLYKLTQALPEYLGVEGRTYQKVTYYIPGVGSRLHGTAGLLAKIHGMAAVHTVVTAYSFIAEYYRPGDHICLFGYSRGAFAARKVASLIFHCGLSATREELLQQWARRDKPVRWHKNSDGFELERRGHQPIPIKYLAVWDTVCAVRNLPHITPVKEMLGIREEELSPNVEHALHAVAFHENRQPFRVTLFEENASTHLQEVWFPGCHSDVGGGGEETTDLPKISLEWMMKRLDIFDNTSIHEMVSLDYTRHQFFNPHNASRHGKLSILIREEDRIKGLRLGKRSQLHQSTYYLETILANDIDKNLLNLNKLSERTGWDRLGNIIYCPRVERLLKANKPGEPASRGSSLSLLQFTLPVLRRIESAPSLKQEIFVPVQQASLLEATSGGIYAIGGIFTGRNGGHLTAFTTSGFRDRVEAYGTDEALRTVALEQHTVSSILKFLDETPGAAEEVDFVQGGRVTCLLSPEQIDDARKDMKAAAEAGVDMSTIEWLEPDAAAQRFGFRETSVYTRGNALWPLKLATKLYQAAKGENAKSNIRLDLFTHTPVISVEPVTADSIHKCLIKTGRGVIKSRFVVHATNGYASHLLPHLANPLTGIVPTQGQCMAIRGSTEATKWPINAGRTVGGYEYWIPRPARDTKEKVLIILGGSRKSLPQQGHNVADDSTIDPIIARSLRDFLPKIYAGEFEERKVEMEWVREDFN
ncbi:unnamed protein product [Rhizoctonia solani]|uniref:T6SS Phospholipase effector Tle1-like catalytic domain-containing protein n=1 Tax=Rhizoctonia solani TaxID=456999 RepID=A0A8H2WG65_9AGAM|nr:unnamed protein product [Rhizoctonia solani]